MTKTERIAAIMWIVGERLLFAESEIVAMADNGRDPEARVKAEARRDTLRSLFFDIDRIVKP